ncbi:MAG: sugar ABC transporter ATP-binding protein [Verrucomicrobia bacterium]|nr:sugar ABC transporter ATP-binding protein [Verrucomicrobiota bacterium]
MNTPTNNDEQRTTHNETVVSFSGIEKSFFGVKVLKGVSFDVGAGSIVGLVGENGAGKSTLMNLLGGILQPDAGELRVNGQTYAPRNPNAARAAGIAFVHQELNLFPNLSIAENLHLTDFPRVGEKIVRGSSFVVRGDNEPASAPQRTTNNKQQTGGGLPWIDRRTLRSRTTELLRQVGLDHAPDTLVECLPAGERQLVEIAKALGADARVIILDEPTTSLSARECERLFTLMHQLRKRAIAIIYISHALGDVLRICDDLVVLRDGERVGGGETKEFTHDRLVSLMVGRQLNQLYPERSCWGAQAPSPVAVGALADHPDGARTAMIQNHVAKDSSAQTRTARARFAAAGAAALPILSVRSLTQPGIAHDISFDLAAGEVLGISGLMGAGRSELARILFGLDPCTSGEIQLAGQLLDGNPRQRIQRGLAFLTEDRRQEGLCMEASIADNIALVTLTQHSRTPARWLDFAGIKSAVSQMREAVRLSPKATDSQPVRTLSGGNQQKVVLGKWLLAEPKVLILDEPTRGIDVGAKFEIYQLIHQLADRGAGVLVISSEIEELIGICDRLLVMRHGELTGEFRREEFDREKILGSALHASKPLAADVRRL